MKTRVTSSPASNCRWARPSNARVDVLKQVEHYYLSQPEVAGMVDVAGFSFNGQGQNTALAFVHLKDWSLRHGTQHSVQAIIGRAFMALSQIKDAIIYPINPPPIPELGISSGFDFELEDQAGLGHEKLMQARDQLSALAAKNPDIVQLRFQGLEDTPQLKVDIDQAKASALGVSLADLNTALTTYFGSDYINNFVNGNRVQRVIAQLDAPYRMLPQDVSKVYVRNNQGQMVSLASLATLHWIYGSPSLQHYNGVPSLELVGSAAPGKSTGQAMDRHGKTGPTIAQGLWLRIDRPVFRGTSLGQASALALRAVAHRGVPVAGRAL